MSSPLIGVTATHIKSRHDYYYQGVNDAYINALLLAGATPVIIPLGVSNDTIDKMLPHFRAILFTGGGDVHPHHYQSHMHPMVSEVDNDRDRIELKLFKDITRQRIPFLGICRGLQLINVAMGGTLFEDILDQRPNSMQHSNFPEKPRNYLAHSIQIQEESKLSRIFGRTTVKVNSMHHQGIDQLASGLAPTAYAEDGVIEALELPDYPFGLAVQWHPECLVDDPLMLSLFQAFVDATENHNGK